MEDTLPLADLLRKHLSDVGWSERQLAHRANIPRGTIRNWLRGVVKKPRNWQVLAQAAGAMRLDTIETNQLLASANHPPINEIWASCSDESDKALIANWISQPQEAAAHAHAPFQVIPDLPYFVGRENVINQLKQALLKSEHPTVYTIHGMGGVGKTSLAAHVAYQLRDYFVDGVLWAKLNATNTMSVLQLFASAFKQNVSQFTDVDSRSQAVRTLLANKRVLIVLDNVESSKQVKPLLPPTGPAAVLLTTRKRNLRVSRGAPQFQLGSFREKNSSSLALFSEILDEQFLEEERPLFQQIADLLGHLPLAIAIVAGRIAYESGWTAEKMLRRLEEDKSRLSTLVGEDECVRTSFNMSFSELKPPQQQFLSTLSLFESNDFDVEAAAYVTEQDRSVTERWIAAFYRLSLIQEAERPFCYRLHPLLSDYAKEQLDDQTGIDRYITYYVQFATQHRKTFDALEDVLQNVLLALHLAFREERPYQLLEGTVAIAPFLLVRGLHDLLRTHLKQAEKAATYINSEKHLATINYYFGVLAERRRKLKKAQAYLDTALRYAHASEDAETLCQTFKYYGAILHEQGKFNQAESYWQQSLDLAEKIEYDEIIGELYLSLGVAALNYRADYKMADKLIKKSLAHARQQEYAPAISVTTMNLGLIAYRLGSYERAQQYLEESYEKATELAFQIIICLLAARRANLLIARTGAYAQPYEIVQRGVQIARELQNDYNLGYLVSELGGICVVQEKHEEASDCLAEALELADKTKQQDILINAKRHLGLLEAAKKQHHQAMVLLDEADQIAKAYGDPWYRCDTLISLATHQYQTGSYAAAEASAEQAIVLAQKHRFLAQEAKALFASAQIANETAHADRARQFAEQARAIFKQIAHAQLADVEAWLFAQPVE